MKKIFTILFLFNACVIFSQGGIVVTPNINATNPTFSTVTTTSNTTVGGSETVSVSINIGGAPTTTSAECIVKQSAENTPIISAANTSNSVICNISTDGSGNGFFQLLRSNGSIKFSADGNSGNIVMNSATLVGGISGTVAVLSDVLFQNFFFSTSTNPADATTYYVTNGPNQLSTSTSFGPITIPYNATLVGYTANFMVNSTVGSAETGTFGIRINSTNTNLSTSITYSAAAGANTFTASGLSTSITAGDVIQPFIIAPTWATNPTGLVTGIVFWFVRRS